MDSDNSDGKLVGVGKEGEVASATTTTAAKRRREEEEKDEGKMIDSLIFPFFFFFNFNLILLLVFRKRFGYKKSICLIRVIKK